MVTDAGKVFHTAAADDYHGVLLQVVAFAGDVGRHFDAVGQAHAGDLTQGRVRLFRGGGVNAGAYAATLRAGLQRRGLLAFHHGFPLNADELIDRGHAFLHKEQLNGENSKGLDIAQARRGCQGARRFRAGQSNECLLFGYAFDSIGASSFL